MPENYKGGGDDVGSTPLSKLDDVKEYQSDDLSQNTKSEPIPNAYILRDSRFALKGKETRLLLRADTGDFVFPIENDGLKAQYSERFDCDPIFDPIFIKPIEIRKIESEIRQKKLHLRDLDLKIIPEASEKGVFGKNISSSNDLSLSEKNREREDIALKIKRLKKRLHHQEKEYANKQGNKVDRLHAPQASEEAVLAEMNRKYAVIHTRSTYILIEKDDKFVLDSRASFIHLHENDFFVNAEGKDVNKAKFWLKHPKRRAYKDLVFNPKKARHYDGNYNIFKGFAVEPQKGDCSLFWQHAREVICDGNEDHYQYLRKWMASVIQKPALLATAIVLRGQQGTGKNIFVETFGAIFGNHFLTLTNLDQIVGKFNSHLQHAYLLFANEAIWGGNKKEVGALKSLITDKTIFIEAKGRDGHTIENNRHLIVCSNEDWAAPIDLDDRRFFCLNVSSKYKGNTSYFKRLVEQMNESGLKALLFDLLNEDLSGFDPRIMPQNDSGFDMKMISASSSVKYIFAALKNKAWNLSAAEHTWEFGDLPSGRLYQRYKDWCEDEGLKPQQSSEFGKELKKLIPSMDKKKSTIDGERVWMYCFPPIDECRQSFEVYTKQTGSIWE